MIMEGRFYYGNRKSMHSPGSLLTGNYSAVAMTQREGLRFHIRRPSRCWSLKVMEIRYVRSSAGWFSKKMSFRYSLSRSLPSVSTNGSYRAGTSCTFRTIPALIQHPNSSW